MLEDNIIFQSIAYILVFLLILGLITFIIKYIRVMIFNKD